MPKQTPTQFNTPEFKKLQTEWYRKAKTSGFNDIELREEVVNGRKTGFLTGEITDGYTSSHGEVAMGDPVPNTDDCDDLDPDSSALLENLDTFGEVTTVWDTPTAAHWRFIASEVQRLPANYKNRAFLEAWAESGEVLNTAKAHGLSRWHGREAVRKFLLVLKKQGRVK